MWQRLHRGGDIHQVGGYEAPQSVCEATAAWVQLYAPKGGRPTKHTKRGPEVVVVETDGPPPLRVRPPPLPEAVEGDEGGGSAPPPEALDSKALGAGVATLVTDAC